MTRWCAREAKVEALCGDLSAIRAPRGHELNALSWQTEAPLRMLLNDLDREVAEKPEELIVYGGSRAVAPRACGRSSERCSAWADETLLVQSGKPAIRALLCSSLRSFAVLAFGFALIVISPLSP